MGASPGFNALQSRERGVGPAPSDGLARLFRATTEGSMAGYSRNDPCPCRSGRKAKRCCGVRRGPGAEELARAFLAAEALQAALELEGLTERELRGLFEGLVELPSLDLSLVLRLPDLLSPELSRLLGAVEDDDTDAADEALPAVLARVDTVEARAALARAVLALRAAGRVGPRLAALAVIDLEGGDDALLTASLIEAAAIAVGAARTPGGLLVAAA